MALAAGRNERPSRPQQPPRGRDLGPVEGELVHGRGRAHARDQVPGGQWRGATALRDVVDAIQWRRGAIPSRVLWISMSWRALAKVEAAGRVHPDLRLHVHQGAHLLLREEEDGQAVKAAHAIVRRPRMHLSKSKTHCSKMVSHAKQPIFGFRMKSQGLNSPALSFRRDEEVRQLPKHRQAVGVAHTQVLPHHMPVNGCDLGDVLQKSHGKQLLKPWMLALQHRKSSSRPGSEPKMAPETPGRQSNSSRGAGQKVSSFVERFRCWRHVWRAPLIWT